MVDSQGVAELDGIQDLKEDTLDQGVIAHEIALFRNAGEEIALGTELNHHVGAIDGIHNANQGNHIGMLAGQMVELDFPLLELELPGIQPGLVEGLDSIQNIGMNVDGRVHHSIGTDAQDAGEFQAVGQEKS